MLADVFIVLMTFM